LASSLQRQSLQRHITARRCTTWAWSERCVRLQVIRQYRGQRGLAAGSS
jgi:hypothetical protein